MTVQEQVQQWQNDQSDLIVCKRQGNAKMRRSICQVRFDAVHKYPGGHRLTDKQVRLREKWSGCRECDQITVSPDVKGD